MSPVLRALFGNLLVAAGYALLGWLASGLSLSGTNAVPLWPAAGLALAAVWRWGPRIAPGIAAGSIAVNALVFAMPWWGALATGTGAATAALAGSWLLRRWQVERRLERPIDILMLLPCVLAAAATAALVGASTWAAASDDRWSRWLAVGWTWLSGDAVGILVLLPLVATWTVGQLRFTVEKALVLAAACVVPLAVFAIPGSEAVSFLALPPLLWASLRCGPGGASVVLLILAAEMWAMTATGHGPIMSAGDSLRRGSLLQGYLGTAAVMSLVLAAVSRSREAAIADRIAGDERYRLVAEHASDLVCLHEPDGRYRWVSPSARKILGYEPDRLVGVDPYSLFHPEDTERVRSVSHRPLLAGGPPSTIEFRIRHQDGSWVWLETTNHPVHGADGEVIAIQTISRDITRRHQDEETLEQARKAAAMAERMAAIGTLAGGVAHEFNNLNAVILGNVELALRRSELPGDTRRRLDMIREAVERERGIVEALLAFSHSERGPGEVSELGAVVATTLALARRTLRQRQVTLHVDLAHEPLHARVPGGSLGQVLLNLVLNACDAIDRRHDPQVWITLVRIGGSARLVVRDNGVGIRPEDLTRIFLPFFSTKGEHATSGLGQPWLRGTGLGLSVCQTLVDQMGGSIGVESAPDAGATFTVTLPLVGAPEPTAATCARPSPCARVLVVDDEPEIRRILAEHLAAAGHVAVEAEDGRHALERLESDTVDLVLLNWNMPGLDGQAFLEHIDLHPERRWPPVVVVSGWMGGDSGIERWRQEIAGELRKPFSLEQVRTTVHSALHGTASGA